MIGNAKVPFDRIRPEFTSRKQKGAILDYYLASPGHVCLVLYI